MKRLLPIFFIAIFCACSVQKPLTEEQYQKSIQKEMPFAVSTMKQIQPETYSFVCDRYVDLLPDYEIDNEGTSMVWRTTFMSTSNRQSDNLIWRNLVISKKNKRVLCIDRLLKNGKTFGYVYVIQGETKQCPQGYHWDVTDHRLMLNVAGAIDTFTDLSVEALNANNNLH